MPKALPKLEPIILSTIGENGHFMENPPIQSFGLPGMLKFKKNVKGWPETYSPEQLLMVLINTWIYNQIGGAGGALF